MIQSQRDEGLTPETIKQIGKQMRQALLATLTPAERLAGLAPEDRLAGLAPEDRLAGLAQNERQQVVAGLAPEERLAGLGPEERLAGLAPDKLAELFAHLEEWLSKQPATRSIQSSQDDTSMWTSPPTVA